MVEVYRRPSRGFPQWFPKWLRGRLDLDGLEAIAGRLDDDKVSRKVIQLTDDLRLVTQAVQGGTTRDALAVVRDHIGLGGAMGLLDSTGAGEGSSHLDDLEALAQVADLHPDPRTFEQWLRRVFHREAAARRCHPVDRAPGQGPGMGPGSRVRRHGRSDAPSAGG